jgi:hypothetical protein
LSAMGVVRDNLRDMGREMRSMLRRSTAWLLVIAGTVGLLAGVVCVWGAMTVIGHIYAFGIMIASVGVLWISSKIDPRPIHAMSKSVEPMVDPHKHSSNETKPGV